MSAAPGHVLGYDDSASKLVVERPNASARAVQPGTVQNEPGASADGKYLISQEGDALVAVTATGVKQLKTPFRSVNTNDTVPASPFADRDRYVLAPRGQGKKAVVTAVPINGGKPVVLGHGYDESGDPSALAAYVTLAVGQPVSDLQDPDVQVQPEGAIKLMAPGKPAETIMTAARIDQIGGIPKAAGLLLDATPSPDGSEVLVTGRTIDAAQARTVLVVLTRSGHEISSVRGNYDGGYWSPDGSRIAYVGGAAINTWQPASNSSEQVPIQTIGVPSAPTPWTDCIWSPTSTWLLCAGGQSVVRGDPTTRLLVDLQTGKAATMKTGDIPLAWLGS